MNEVPSRAYVVRMLMTLNHSMVYGIFHQEGIRWSRGIAATRHMDAEHVLWWYVRALNANTDAAAALTVDMCSAAAIF